MVMGTRTVAQKKSDANKLIDQTKGGRTGLRKLLRPQRFKSHNKPTLRRSLLSFNSKVDDGLEKIGGGGYGSTLLAKFFVYAFRSVQSLNDITSDKAPGVR